MSSNVNINGQSVLNVNPTPAVPLSIFKVDPTPTDTKNFTLGWHWLNKTTGALFYLAGNTAGSANWVPITVGGAGPIIELAGNTGEAFPVSGVIQISVPTGNGTATIAGVGNDLNLTFANVATGNIGLGTQSLNSVTSGVDNTAYGIETLSSLTSGDNNIALGAAAGTNITTGNRNILIGTDAGFNYTVEDDNICIGNNVEGVVGDANVLRVGNGTGSGEGQLEKAFISGIAGVTVPGSLNFVTIDTATGQLGSQAGTSTGVNSFITSPATGTATPAAGVITITGTGGAVVTASGSTISIASSSTGTGVTTIDGDTGSISGTTVSLTGLTTAGSSVSFHGATAAMTLNVSDASNNTIIGGSAGNGSLTGTFNTGLGEGALHALTSGAQNTAFGYQSLNALQSSGNNTAIGRQSMMAATTASTNTAVGSASLIGLISGANNVCAGYGAGSAYVGAESSNICIGYSVNGTANESHVCRIGASTDTGAGGLTSTYIQGIAGVTTTNTQFVTINTSTGQLGSATSVSGSASVFATRVSQNNATTTYYPPFGGQTNGLVDEGILVPTSGTVSNFYANVTGNTSSGTTTATIYINGSPTAVTFTIPPMTVGTQSDLVHSASVSAGQLISYQVTTTGTGSITMSLSNLFTT